jgi:pectinesterase
LIFNQCRITTAKDVDAEYLGRPWRAYAMTLFMNSELPAGIRPAGWHNWDKAGNEKTARYLEYNNSGRGAAISARVPWIKILTSGEAAIYTLSNVMQGWDPLSH